MTTASTIAPVAHPTNPAAFLAELQRLGGGYCLTPDGQLYLGMVHTDASPDQHGLALGLIASLSRDNLAAIKQHVAGIYAEPACSPVEASSTEAPKNGDSALVAAWEEARALSQALNTGDEVLPYEKELLARLVQTELFIADAPATTTAGILAKLQLAALNCCDDPADNAAMVSGDYEHLQKSASNQWDFNDRVVFSALQSLRAMRAEATPDLTKAWAEAVAAERAAHEAAEQYHANHAKPVYTAHDAGMASMEDVAEQEQAYGKHISAHHEAVTAMMLTPAPDWRAVMTKLRANGEDSWYFDGSDECQQALRAIAADVQRLSGEA